MLTTVASNLWRTHSCVQRRDSPESRPQVVDSVRECICDFLAFTTARNAVGYSSRRPQVHVKPPRREESRRCTQECVRYGMLKRNMLFQIALIAPLACAALLAQST